MDCVRSRRLTASKTKKVHPIPTAGFLARHIRAMNATGRLFGSLPEKQLRRELANDLAGRIIHGEGLSRVMAHYVQPVAVLDRWAPQVEVPSAWLTPKERADAIRAEDELLRHYRRASVETRDALLRIARAV